MNGKGLGEDIIEVMMRARWERRKEEEAGRGSLSEEHLSPQRSGRC